MSHPARPRLVLPLLVLLFALGVGGSVQPPSPAAAVAAVAGTGPELLPTDRHRSIARRVFENLDRAHYSQVPLDDRMSSEIFDLYIESLARQVDQIKYVGDFGAMSCSPAGAGGFTGCTQKFVEAWAKDREEADGVRFGQLIEQARQERLSTIDADAAAEQERVEMIEREYMERLERERQAELPGEGDLPPPPK